ncbi:MAG TPA: 2,3,4,5-tetrahydropyridine-2,6-dicarboxylate N-succinyltransferase, partial [Burkholderiales bacterium]|nr:2,3,4,5-tetrahydropyridine-2,6-dicarboxylate N-succinyltransferase [Burkholderiales bacterium]
MQQLAAVIEQAWENRAALSPTSADAAIRDAVNETIAQLDSGKLRVAEKQNGEWVTHQWVKKAVLLSFRLQ